MRAVRTPVLEWMVTRLPPWALAAVAVLCVAAGVVLTLSPFTSAGVLVVLVGLNAIATAALLLAARDEAASGYRELLGVGWLILGVVILARPSLAVAALAVVIGVALVVTGVVDVAGALTGRQTERAAALIGGLAAITFGVLALSWPDVTIFVVAVLFGARTVLFGLSLLLDLTRPWWGPKSETETALPGWLRAGWRLASRVVALVLALLLVAVSATLHRGAPSPVPAFYDWTGAVPTTPGELLRSEPMTSSIPSNAQGWRILYSTKTSLGKPAIGSGFVLAPKELPAGPRPVILWTHGTEGIARTCAPSLFPDVTAAIPAVPDVLDRGWVLVAPDYVGMGTAGPTPYMIGTGQAYPSLDAVRAAFHLQGLSLANQIVVWGHSQGGHAALWTGKLAGSYAPELKILGVAAMAPATDLIPLAAHVEHTTVGSILAAYLLGSYSTTYANVRFGDYVRPGATAQVTQAANRCLADPGLAASVVIAATGGGSVFSKDYSAGPLGDRLRENTPTGDVGGIPLLITQGTGDEVINVGITEQWVPQQCAAGYKLAFKTYPDLTHMGLLRDSAFTTDLVNWTVDRFAGAPAPNTCP